LSIAEQLSGNSNSKDALDAKEGFGLSKKGQNQ